MSLFRVLEALDLKVSDGAGGTFSGRLFSPVVVLTYEWMSEWVCLWERQKDLWQCEDFSDLHKEWDTTGI